MIEKERLNIDDYVAEKWWHRLSRVLIYASTALVLAISGAFFFFDGENYTHSFSYSFEDTFSTGGGDVSVCYHFKSDDSIFCGDIPTFSELLTRFRSHTQAADSLKPSDSHKYSAFLRDRETLIELLDKGNIRYRDTTHWKIDKLVRAAAYSVGISIVWYTCTFLLYKTLLFIVHGHTRVSKC